ncbi:MAG TPA: membrane protein insertion efficiency factor YidD [Candidatus Desulfofervidus auxilii]|uniref:Putative membrane protein insertion efficiency factor n=1 Tax=Desulfofervidus auxilii TaxID=1621989 RepID=A0A7C0Y2N8_DESA2|nr:membrane protein insertion efficiency factor YidD [Candidatus Desulfofervidus auxilii]HDD44146.1 membrane protein insertion efficiency factor YidD [Candidatus Desulfofervidus auxilii]
MKVFIIFLIKLYQKIFSPFIPSSCRFYPSCSNYAIEAINRYGLLKGGLKTLLRVARCHPFHPGGYDPVK